MGGGFPGSSWACIAYVRQIYLDAAHYQLVKEAYAQAIRAGWTRPEYDRALEGVLESKQILLPANRLLEIDRMLRFAAELKQRAILYGARESYRPEAADLLEEGRRSGAGEPALAGGAARSPIRKTWRALRTSRRATRRRRRRRC